MGAMPKTRSIGGVRRSGEDAEVSGVGPQVDLLKAALAMPKPRSLGGVRGSGEDAKGSRVEPGTDSGPLRPRGDFSNSIGNNTVPKVLNSPGQKAIGCVNR